MTRDDEEQRALLYRQQQKEGRAARLARYRKLAGNPAAVAQVHANWEPVVLAQLERRDAGNAGGRAGDECQ